MYGVFSATDGLAIILIPPIIESKICTIERKINNEAGPK